jgi:acetyl esterase/lipase
MSRLGTPKAYRCAVARDPHDILTDPPPPAADERIAYGAEPLQFADVRNADADALAIVLHGGSWKATYNLTHLAHLCILLGEEGVPTLNVEYRRVGDPGGGWPGSLEDVLRAVEFASTRARRFVLVGHSAGGHLALLAAKRTGVPVVALAAVCDPPTWRNDAVAAFFAGKRPPPEASPLAQAPAGVPTIVVHGTADEVVPFGQSQRYAEAAGDEATLHPLDGAGHFEPIDPQSPEVDVTLRSVAELLA